jgi:hypothetical protein
MKPYKGVINPWGITKNNGEIVSLEYLKSRIQQKCNWQTLHFQEKRKKIINIIISDAWMKGRNGETVSSICERAVLDGLWLTGKTYNLAGEEISIDEN